MGPQVNHPPPIKHEGVVVAHAALRRAHNLFVVVDAVSHAVRAPERAEVGYGIELRAGGAGQREQG